MLLVEYSLRLLQVLRVESPGEPGIDGREKTERFVPSALINPQRGKVPCSSKLKRSGLLASCTP